MRYLIFNITVLSALGYLFMASPDQSFTNWLGKTPQMFDAARSAGRDASTTIDPSETAGTALLEAMEPVIEEVLSPPVEDATDQTALSQPASGHPASGHPASGHPASGHPASGQLASNQTGPVGPVDSDNPPVTMRDIETMIRALLETKETPDSGPDAAEAAKLLPEKAQDDGVGEARSQSQPESVDAPKPVISELAATPPLPAGRDADIAVVDAEGQPRNAAPTVSQEMSDADIAAAFSQLQQSTASQQPPAQMVAASDIPAVTDPGATSDQTVTAGDMAVVPETPVYMSPGQRADSLALMVEELQLMYLERTGG